MPPPKNANRTAELAFLLLQTLYCFYYFIYSEIYYNHDGQAEGLTSLNLEVVKAAVPFSRGADGRAQASQTGQ